MKNTYLILIAFSIFIFSLICCDNGSSGSAEIDTFSISYNSNGAEFGKAPAGQKGDIKTAQAIQANVGNLAKNGYVFECWNTAKDGSGTNYTPGTSYKTGKNLVLYAKWVRLFNYSVENQQAAQALNGTQKAPGLSYARITGLTEKGRQFSDINIPDTIDGYRIASIGNNAFQGCDNVASITIPATVTTIGANAFSGCSSIEAITIPASVTSIGSGAFSSCASLTSLVMLSTTPPAMGDNVLADTTATVSVPASGVTAYMSAEGWNTYSSSISGYSTEVLTVTFDPQGGTIVATSATIKVEPPAVTVGQLPPDPVYQGYKFGGWNTQADGQGTDFTASTVVTANMTVYAQWISHRYTVTFDGQGSDSEPDPASVIVESPNTTVSAFPAGLSRHGFFFGGWFTEENGKGTEFTTSTTVNDNITVYAYWTEHPEYKVTFNGQDATTEADPACISVKSPATTVGTLPTAPSRTGYIFGGWFTQPNGGGYAFTENTEVTDNITVFAKWNEYKYTVSFDKQGGDTEANPASIDVKSPDTTVKTLPASPTKEGCYFSGWFTKTNGEGTAFTENTVVTDNITVYAYWTAKPVYTVTFDSQGAETHADPESITLENSATTVGTLPTQPIKKGYDFGGWFTEVNGGGSEFLANTTVTASLTVFAKWTAQTYAIIYKDKGGSDFSGTHGSNHPTSHTYGTATTLVNPTKADYDFGGWYTTSDCTGDAVTTLGATAFTQNITLYAKWIQKQAPVATYTVTFNSQNADTDAYPPSIEVTSPAATTVGVLPSEPVKEGYIFDSWNTRADGTGTAFTASTMVTGNITVYALWKENGLVYCKYETVGSDLVVTGLTRAGEDQSTIIIPSMINGKNVTKIGREAFEEENELTQIILPDGLISIEERAFHECDNLTSIILPDSLTTIGAEAFLECSKLSNITIPQNVTSIGEGAFGVCDVLNITVGNGNQSYCIVNGILFNKNKTKLFFCPRNIIGSYSIPNGVVSIGDYAFEGCKGLSDITIPDSVTSIGYYAFEDCSGLKNITIPKNVTSIGEYAFSLSGEGFSIIINATTPPAPLDIYNPYFISNDFALLSIIVPSASIDTYKSAAGWSEYVDKIVGDGYTYKVTFDSCNSDTPASPASIEVTSPATTVGTLPSEPVKEGYIFDGWNTKSDGTGTAFSADTTVSGDITVYAVWIGVNELFVYNIKNSVVTITGLTSLGKSQTELVIPDKIEGYPVTGIGVGAQTSTDGAFYNCTNLVSVTIPSGVTTIGGAAFYGCTGLTRVSIPDSVTVIDWRAFQRCTNLTDITIPDGVTTIGYYAFSDCTKLSSMTIPASVTSVGKGAFYCDFSVVDGNTNYSCSDGILFNKNKTKLVSCPLGKKGNYVIPNTVTIVGEDAFTECAGLTSITIPENVVSIGNYAFYKCTGLTTVNYNAVNCTLSDEAYAPFYGCSSLTTLNIGNNVETIPGYLFYSCSKLTNITFGNSLHSIGESAFEGCTGLISVSLPDSLTEIGEDAFYECTKLSSITIPDNVIKVASGAFKKCTSLTTVNFNAIYCTVMGDDDKGCFDGCKKITKINIGNKVTIIPNDAFNGCTGLTSITIPDNVVSIGLRAFARCTKLTNITVDNGNPNYCSLDGVVFNKNKTKLIIFPMSKSGSYSIPSGITSIDNGTFTDCTGLTSVTIPNSVVRIGSAFVGCTGLISVRIENTTPPSLSSSGFYECTNLKEILVPASSFNTYYNADVWCYYADKIDVEDGYIVTFDSQDATTPSEPKVKLVILPSTQIDSMPSDPIKTGYEFDGWYTGKNGEGTRFTENTVITKSITVYANWILKYIEKDNVQIGDIVLQNGKYVNYSDFSVNSAEYMSISQPAGIICYKGLSGTSGITGKVYMVGLNQGTLLNWAPSGTTGYKTKFSTSDTAGEDNWGIIKAADSNGTKSAGTNYPAFNYANTYSVNGFTDGWFLPSWRELYQVFDNIIKINNSINDIISAGGIATALPSSAISGFWSSSNYNIGNNSAYFISIQNGNVNYGSLVKNSTSSVVVVRALDD